MASDPAPALRRGLALLRCLAGLGPSRLDRMARELGWAKSSTLRLLETLAADDLVAQTEGKLWHALQVLVPAAHAGLRQGLAGILQALSQAGTAECWIIEPLGLRLLDRREGLPGGVGVQARIGQRRRWGEVEATTQVALAWEAAPMPARPFRMEGAKRIPIGLEQLPPLLAQVRSEGLAVDQALNAKGVRRWAAPLLDRQGRLLGVLVVACRGQGDGRQAGILRVLANSFQAAAP